MSLILSFFLLLGGIVLLIWAGDVMVRGAAALARQWGVPALIVGLTIVAFGTSAPELVVGVQAVLAGASELASANVVGSNIANILLAIGLPALVIAIPTNTPGVARNSLVMLVATASVVAAILLGTPIGRVAGAALFAGIVAYLLFMFRLARSGASDPLLDEMQELEAGTLGMSRSRLLSLVQVVLGIVGLVVGGHLIVDNASLIAASFGVSEAIIGLTIVALGTSLPEIATVLVAAYRGQSDVAIGNVLGSNIFNSFAVLGTAALVGPVAVDREVARLDMWVMLVAAVVLFALILTRRPIGRGVGLALVLAYAVFMALVGTRMM